MQSTKISVIVPVYNVENYLPQFIENILGQSFKNIELLLIDDGSTDDSKSICTKYADLNPTIFVHSQKNQGAGIARNHGIAKSSGDYLYFIDPDDLLYDQNSLQNLYDGIHQNKADICGGNFIAIKNTKLDKSYAFDFRFKENRFFKKDYLPNQDGFFWRFIYKADFIKTHQIEFPDYFRGQDPIFLLKCFEQNPKVQTITDNVYVYRIGHKNINWNSRKIFDWLKSKKQVLELCHKNKYTEILKGKIIWTKTQWDEILEAGLKCNIDISEIVKEINQLVDWDDLSSDLKKEFKPLEEGHIIFPFFSNKSVPIVLATDENYAPYLAVTLQSIITNSNKNTNYDIIVLTSELNKDTYRRLMQMVSNHTNISLRFFDMSYYIKKYKSIILRKPDQNLSPYFRIFIPQILKNYSKAIYVDCDLVVNKDLASLYETEVKDHLLAAAPAVGPIRAYHSGNFKDYFDQKLKLKKPNTYFNSGVLVLNIKKMNEENILEKLLTKTTTLQNPILMDQDLLNSVCQGKVYLLDLKWNFTVHIAADPTAVINTPPTLYKALKKAMKEPYIIHYTSSNKPWNSNNVILSDYFWKYAKSSSFYEEILIRLANTSNRKNQISPLSFKTSNRIRKIRYKVLSKISIGKKRERYKEKLRSI